MLHSIAVLGTLTSVLLHAMLGCCVHHAHAVCLDACVVNAVSEPAHHCSGHDRNEPAYHPADEGTEHDPHHCNEHECAFVATNRIDAGRDVRLLVNWSRGLPSFNKACTEDSPVVHVAGWSDPACLMEPHSLRAILQVWRI